MSIYDFAKECFENNGYGFDQYTVEDAAADIENFMNSGWELPDDITAENFAEAMNEIISDFKEDE